MEPHPTELVSGEGVRLALAPAGVGSRLIAALIDVAIQFGALLILILITVSATSGSDDAATAAFAVTEVVLVLAGYPIAMEWLTRGRTVGKMCLGLRVVRDDGGPVGFRQALVRGLAGLVLEKPGLLFPFTTIAGLVTISCSAREKRIGDMMAATVVLNEHSAPPPLATPPSWVPVPLQAWVLSLDLYRLDDRLALSARQFVSRAYAMTPDAQWELGEELRRRVLAVISPAPPAGAPTPLVLASVLAERRRRASAGTPGPWSAPVPMRPPAPPPGRPGPPQPAPASQWDRAGSPPPDRPPPPRSPFAPPS